jgi:hypothetical protein
MDQQRADEIERKVFYRRIEGMMRLLEKCEDTHIVFEIGLEMGYLHSDLKRELEKEIVATKED